MSDKAGHSVGEKRKAAEGDGKDPPTPQKKAALKTSPPADDVLLLEWTDYSGDDPESFSITIDKENSSGKMSTDHPDAVQKCDLGECNERTYCIRLVDRSTQEETLASLNFFWWEQSRHASLMAFNVLSGDMAQFCAALWTAAGIDEPYCDFAIEMGHSEYSHEEINNLIAMTGVEGADECKVAQRVAYVDNVSGNAKDAMCGKRIMEGLVTLLGEDSNIIAHETDLHKLCISSDVGNSEFGFDRLNEGGQWHVRAAGP